MRFREEFTAYALGKSASPSPTAPSKRDHTEDEIRRAGEVTVAVNGKAYLSKPETPAEVTA
jgi:hypothetical protein